MKEKGVIERVNRFYEYLGLLEDLAQKDLDTFMKSPYLQLSAERLLHLSIEILLDLGNYLINALSLPKPSTYAEIFKILCEHDILPRDMMNSLMDMARFRNVLVHGYIAIDKKRVYEILVDNLDMLKYTAEKIIYRLDELEEKKKR